MSSAIPGRRVWQQASRTFTSSAQRCLSAPPRQAIPSSRALAVRGWTLARTTSACARANVKRHVLAATFHKTSEGHRHVTDSPLTRPDYLLAEQSSRGLTDCRLRLSRMSIPCTQPSYITFSAHPALVASLSACVHVHTFVFPPFVVHMCTGSHGILPVNFLRATVAWMCAKSEGGPRSRLRPDNTGAHVFD